MTGEVPVGCEHAQWSSTSDRTSTFCLAQNLTVGKSYQLRVAEDCVSAYANSPLSLPSLPVLISESNSCASSPCVNGGVCIEDAIDSFHCTCAAGFTGVFCERNIDECVSLPCQNEGTCWDGLHSFTCQCMPGFRGSWCEINIDECGSHPCHQGTGSLSTLAFDVSTGWQGRRDRTGSAVRPAGKR